MFKIKVHQGEDEKTILAHEGTNLLKLLAENGFVIESPCGGMGICGKCRVRVIEDESENSGHYELACSITIDKDMIIEVPKMKKRDAQIMTSGELDVPLNPSIVKEKFELQAPDIQDQLSDVERIEAAIGKANSIPSNLMPDIPNILRDNDFKVSVVTSDDRVLSIEPHSTQGHSYGIAIDIGTTTIVGYLLDLHTGEQLGLYSSLNPQSTHGADVITRVDYTIESVEGLSEMSGMIRDEINNMISNLCRENNISPNHIYEIDIVGNTVMVHIFAGLPVKNIATSPFVPVISRELILDSKTTLGICDNAQIRLLPTISGYVGADMVAAILASGMHESDEIELLIDIGTNGEIALGNKEKIVTCSTAAGPAFEGARIECGMGGVEGAINRVYIDDKIRYTTIGGLSPEGICGSGIVDITAQMLKANLLEPSGRLISPEEAAESLPASITNHIELRDGQPLLRIDKSTYISQKDIREVQLAKAAIAAGVKVLMEDMDISYEDISCVYLAGGFGSYIDHGHAVDIGLISEAFRDKIKSIGNGAGAGAKMTLLSKDVKAQANDIKEKTRYIELSARADFQTHFVDSLNF